MANAAAILNKINRAIARVAPVSQLVYKRVVTSVGDPLIGKVTSTYVDTLLTPQPITIETGRQKLSGERDSPTTVITPNNTRITSDDYVLNLSASSISRDELEDENLVFVLKDSASGMNTTLYMMDYSSVEYQGTVLAYKVYARNVRSKVNS